MLDVVEESPVLEPGTGASESSEGVKQEYVDTSIDTSIDTGEAEAKPEEVEEEPKIEAESPPADDGNVEEKKPGSAEERVKEVIGKWRTSERESEAKDAVIDDLRQELAAHEVPPEPLKEPEDFATRAEYNTYLQSEMKTIAKTAVTDALSEAGEKAESDKIGESFAEREKVFVKDNPDYQKLVYDRGLRISDAMKDVIQTEENGLDLAIYLGENPDIAKDIAEMSDVNAGMRLTLLLADIGDEKAKADEKLVTKAPPPVPKIATSETSLGKDPADMTDKEFAKWRRKTISNR